MKRADRMKTMSLILSFLTISICSYGQTTTSNSLTTPGKDTLDIPSRIKMVVDTEPGEPMIISGTIYLPGGKTPAKGAMLSVWQTDTKGNYIEGGGGAGELHPRIHGRMKTGPHGRYEFRTIKPAPYPNNSAPAHVHGHVSAPGFPEYPIIYYFEGDKSITEKNRSELNSNRGGTPSIIRLTLDRNGVLIGYRDIILEYVKPTSETMKLQW
jgi:protocatechuate 3,4-dioxygenase beta subunit